MRIPHRGSQDERVHISDLAMAIFEVRLVTDKLAGDVRSDELHDFTSELESLLCVIIIINTIIILNITITGPRCQRLQV